VWVSIVVNLPISQEEVERRLDSYEQTVVEKLAREREREVEALARAMRYNKGEIPSGSVVDRLRSAVAVHNPETSDPALGDSLVRALAGEQCKEPGNDLISLRSKANRCGRLLPSNAKAFMHRTKKDIDG
jgi:hypothetical protein